MSTAIDLFTKTYSDRDYRYPTMLRHAGTLISFAMDADRRILYSVLDFGPGATTSATDADHWSADPVPLRFTTEIASVGIGLGEQSPMPQVRLGSTMPVPAGQPVRPDELDPFLSSTARLGAAAPFQVLSDGRYVYLLRPAITDPSADQLDRAQRTVLDPAAGAADVATARDLLTDHAAMVYVTDPITGDVVQDAHGRPVPVVAGTLLVDRFVLVGTTLEAKLEVRFQRSRSRTRPASSTDSLGATDLQNRPFVEPTQNLRFVPPLSSGSGGGFAALLIPTAVADVFRWQLFSFDAARACIWSQSIARTKDGLFDTFGSGPLTCTDHPDLFALAPGHCPRPALKDPDTVCDLPLVPKAGGDAVVSGTALSFPADGSAGVTFAGSGPIGARFTVEAWIAADPAGNGERSLLAGDGSKGSAAPSIWVVDGTGLRAGFGDGRSWHQITAADVLTPGRWNHVAVSFGDGLLQVYVDGALQQPVSVDASVVPTAATVTHLGRAAAGKGFAGLVDEVRIWSVALTSTEIEASRHRRLTGTEGGLAGYWRLDEGTGSTTFDQSPAGARGTISGATWASSDAPLTDPLGLTRSAIRMAGRRFTGALGATIYYQQEPVSSGYDPQAKPLKHAARVMLATGTVPDPGGDHPLVAAFDFGVATDGTLAQLPTEVTLAEVDSAGGSGDIGGEVLDLLVKAQSDAAALLELVPALSTRLTSATSALTIVDAVLAGAAPTPFPAEYAALDPAAAAVQAMREHIYALQHAGGEVEYRLRMQLIQQSQDELARRLATLGANRPAIQASVDSRTHALADAQAGLAAATAQLETLQRRIDADTLLPMPLLHLDTRGLSVSGAVLGFAPAVERPVLVESALGRVALYLRGSEGSFLVAYYDTSAGRARFTVPTQAVSAEGQTSSGVVAFVARSTQTELDDLQVTVGDGPDGPRCTVTITSAKARATETWTGVPRQPRLLAGILSGTAPAPVFVGSTAAVDGKTDTLTIPDGLQVPVPAGGLLRIGGLVLSATEEAARGAGAVTVEPMELHVPAGTAVHRIAYDPAAASSSRVGADLSTGSLLVAADAGGAIGDVVNGVSSTAEPTAACRWFGAPPGTTLAFDGKTTSVGVLAHTALQFDGLADGVELARASALDVTGVLTIAAWIRPASLDDVRDIVAHGPSDDLTREVYLRIFDHKYQVGSFDGTDHFAEVPVPPSDLNHWVHLAGVYDGTRWLLYRNGLLLGSGVPTSGPVPVNTAWTIGFSAQSDRNFAGDIDEVRIWSRALSPQEITDGMNRRLSGTEAALVGYWYVLDGVWSDRTANNTRASYERHPAITSSPPVLARLSGFDIVDDVTVETWLKPTSTEPVSRVLVHSSPASSYGLALRRQPSAARLGSATAGGIQLPDVPALQITGKITLEAWIRPSASDGFRDIIARGPTLKPSPEGEVYLRLSSGQYQVGAWLGIAGGDVAASAPVPAGDLNTWVHLAGVYDGTAWRLYRNGELLASSPNSTTRGAMVVPAPWTVGVAFGGGRSFAGDVDEVRIWNVGRSAADIAATMNTRLSGQVAGLVGAWHVDGDQFHDASAQHLDVVLGPKPVVLGPIPSTYSAIVTIGGQGAETVAHLPVGEWSHVAASFEQHYSAGSTFVHVSPIPKAVLTSRPGHISNPLCPGA